MLISSDEPLPQAFSSGAAQPRSDKAQTARIRAEEIDQREQGPPTHWLRPVATAAPAIPQRKPATNSASSAIFAHARRDRRGKTQLRLFRRDQELWNTFLQHERGCERIDDAAIAHAVLQHPGVAPRNSATGRIEHHAGHREQHAEQRRKEDHHGKIAVWLPLPPALAERFETSAVPPVPIMKPMPPSTMINGMTRLDRRKGRLFRQSSRRTACVHHAVDRRKDHHDNGRKTNWSSFR